MVRPVAEHTLPMEVVGDGTELRLEGPGTFPEGDSEQPVGPKAVYVPTQVQFLKVISLLFFFFPLLCTAPLL